MAEANGEATANGAPARARGQKVRFFPREHGATAMLITPMVCAAILARTWSWAEIATGAAAFAALAAKDPLVIVARQRLVWKQQREESAAAARWLAGWMTLLVASGLVLLATWPWKPLVAMGLGVAVFSGLAAWVNVRNRQRSTLFQIASALALTSSSLAVCVSATGGITPWCWWLWGMLALQATAGILVVHARLDARIALRGKGPASEHFRRAATVALGVMLLAASVMILGGQWWLAGALAVAAAGYWLDLRGQRDAAKLQLPLTRVGQRALALSSVYAILLIVGLWRV